ncbi:MAG: 6-phosphogluconolactonase [Deltaproteobacteria bacterium]|nr:6-phosphogluconolactonase [Deltaproteobacteria bacterium]
MYFLGTINAMSPIHVCSNPEALYQQAAALFVRFASEATSTRGRFNVALSGGSTPRGVHKLLTEVGLRERIPWPQVHLFWGDERCVASTHPESNYRMTEETLVTRVPIPLENVHRIPTEKAPLEAANDYEQTIREAFALSKDNLPRFDLVFLGMGPDGHTASLFPGTTVLREGKRLVIAHCVEKLNAWRITLTPPVLSNAAHVVFLVCGADKASTLRKVLQGPYQSDLFPAQLIRPVNGTLLWLVDQDAASLLNNTEERV